MTSPVYPLNPETLYISYADAKNIGAKLASSYQGKNPYDYGCFDNFLSPDVVNRVREEALALGTKDPEHSSGNEKLKTSFKPDIMPAYSKAVFHALSSRPFIQFLEQMSGIKGLIPDPYYQGGGIHRSETSGFLSIHADFDYHSVMNLERRLNVLIYLNPDWKEEYGGAFEIWTDDMSKKVDSFVPVMNRMCCFSTGRDTMHGNPEPVNHPNGDPRLSIALYYYTATWVDGRTSQSTVFKPRPGAGDAKSNETLLRVVRDIVPPVVYRKSRSLLSKIRGQ